MTGFLGTVVGMIQAFHKMATAGGQMKLELIRRNLYHMTTTLLDLLWVLLCWIQSPS
jgi:biopolymer transport protein ExbB